MAALTKPPSCLKVFAIQHTMNDRPDHSSSQYTCNEYRAEMILLALQNKLQQTHLDEKERLEVIQEIARLEKIVGLT